MNIQPTLINLDNSLDDNYVYDSLGSNQHSLLHALIRILNRLQYPESVIIPNKTLEHKSGIPSRTFHRTRESLIQYIIDGNDPESWVVRYEPSNHGTAGRYWLNYSYILSNYKTPTSHLHDTDINTTTQLHDDIITPTSDLQDDCNTIQKNDESGNIHRIDKNRTDENTKNKIGIGSVNAQSLKDKDDSTISEFPISYSSRDANGRYIPVMREDDNGKRPLPVTGNTELDDFRHILTFPRDMQLILIKRLDAAKQARFYEFAKGENNATE